MPCPYLEGDFIVALARTIPSMAFSSITLNGNNLNTMAIMKYVFLCIIDGVALR